MFLCRQELSREMIDFAGRLKAKFEERLKGQNVTIAVDGGKVHKKLQTVSVLMDKKAFFLKSTKVMHNDHQTILAVLKDAKLMLEKAGAIVCAVVGDNHSGVQKAIAKFCEENPLVCIIFRNIMTVFFLSSRFSK